MYVKGAAELNGDLRSVAAVQARSRTGDKGARRQDGGKCGESQPFVGLASLCEEQTSGGWSWRIAAQPCVEPCGRPITERRSGLPAYGCCGRQSVACMPSPRGGGKLSTSALVTSLTRSTQVAWMGDLCSTSYPPGDNPSAAFPWIPLGASSRTSIVMWLLVIS